ncbi:MAG TPA: EAL domain-containing protein [Methylophilaceae bacterium]|nr:EAL domain-containing protein [Methylophilaceae bacterium]
MAIYFILNLVAMIIIFSILLGYEYYSFRKALITNIDVQAKIIESNASAALAFSDEKNAEEILSALRYSPAIQRAEIKLIDGKPFASYQKSTYINSIDLSNRQSLFNWSSLLLKYNLNISNQPVAHLEIEASLSGLYTSLVIFAAIAAIAGLLALAGAYILSRRLHRSISEPLLALTELTNRITLYQDFTVRSSIASMDEIGRLANGLNKMLSHIEVRDAELEAELSQRLVVERNLDQLAHYDNVTGLPNRHFFNNYLEVAISKARNADNMLGVIFIDLDNFKIVNDTLGHQAGDILLKDVAQRIYHALNESEVICRIGGDEFSIVMDKEASPERAESIAKNIIAALSEAFNLDSNKIYVGASIGISFFPTQASDMSSLLSSADAAMYQAKSMGKNNFQHYQVEMEGRVRRRLNMENSLRRAIEANELEIYYQPQIDVYKMRITGFEALLRWNHPKMGMISPAEFIPLAEESGLILPIGDWVMVTACYQAKVWQKAFGKDLRMAVNFSAKQLKDDAMVDKVLHALLITDLEPHTLDIELTESSLMENSEASVAKMAELRRSGIHISIDDFGTGFSSLSYLKRFPLSALKIDRSFICDIPGDQDDIAITNAIIALANTLKIEVIAEGVETHAQLEYLRNSNCGNAQGFLFSRPLPVNEMESLLKSLKHPLQFDLNITLDS